VAIEDRGFASMDRGKQRDIASKGGKAAHQKGTAHEWTAEEAREAGRKGGLRVTGGSRTRSRRLRRQKPLKALIRLRTLEIPETTPRSDPAPVTGVLAGSAGAHYNQKFSPI